MHNMIDNRVEIGITGFPPRAARLSPGSFYLIAADHVSTRWAVMVQSLYTNLKAGQPCTFVSPQAGDITIDRACSIGIDLIPFLRSGMLDILETQPDCEKNMLRQGVERLIRELDFYDAHRASLLVFDAESSFFSLHDPFIATKQIESVNNWLRSRDRAGLLVIEDHILSSPLVFDAIKDRLNGLIRLQSAADPHRAFIDFWYSDQALPANSTVEIDFKANGQVLFQGSELLATTTSEPEKATLDTKLSQQRVLYVGQGYDTWWEIHHGNWDKVPAFSDMSRRAAVFEPDVVVVAVSNVQDMQPAAEAIYRFKRSYGAHVPVIVRETDFTVRFSNERIFERCGATQLIYRNTALAMAAHILENITIAPRLDTSALPSPEQVSTSFVPADVAGHLSLDEFQKYVANVIKDHHQHHIPYALLRGEFTGENKDKLIRLIDKNMRGGDVATSLGSQCWLFFSDCDPRNAETVLLRLCELSDARPKSAFHIASQLEPAQSILHEIGDLTNGKDSKVTSLRRTAL